MLWPRPETRNKQNKRGPGPLYVFSFTELLNSARKDVSRYYAGDDIGGCRLAADRARDRLFRGLIVEVLNLLIVLGVPMDEHTDANEQIVGFANRDHASRDTIGDSFRDAVLGRPEHLHGLGRILDRHLVEQNGRGLDEQVGSHHREQRGETILIVGKGSRERRFGRAAARSNDEIDMSNFVAVPDERFADTELVYLGHA